MTTQQIRTIDWVGKSGARYRYEIYPATQALGSAPGNYVWAREDSPGLFTPLYVGEASSLGDRVNRNHEKVPCVTAHGVTHITVHVNHGGLAARLMEETDIRHHYNPPCNRQ